MPAADDISPRHLFALADAIVPGRWNAASLEEIHGLVVGSLRRGIGELSRGPIRLPDWGEGRRAQDDVFGCLNSATHGFAVRPLDWIRLSEPQVTQGWQHFLTEPGVDSSILRARQVAFLESLLRLSDRKFPMPGDASPIRVAAEMAGRVSGRGRSIDLVFEWRDAESQPFVVAVEFKFGHRVTKGQLPDYRQIVKRRARDMCRARLVLVLASQGSYPAGKRRAKDWRIRRWSDLLRRLERRLSDPSEEFARFRRTVWDRASTRSRNKGGIQ